MWEDPIVAEVHRIREELAARFNYDIHAMFADMRERQEALGTRLVSLVKPAEQWLQLTGAAIPSPRDNQPLPAAPAAEL